MSVTFNQQYEYSQKDINFLQKYVSVYGITSEFKDNSLPKDSICYQLQVNDSTVGFLLLTSIAAGYSTEFEISVGIYDEYQNKSYFKECLIELIKNMNSYIPKNDKDCVTLSVMVKRDNPSYEKIRHVLTSQEIDFWQQPGKIDIQFSRTF